MGMEKGFQNRISGGTKKKPTPDYQRGFFKVSSRKTD